MILHYKIHELVEMIWEMNRNLSSEEKYFLRRGQQIIAMKKIEKTNQN